MSEADKLRAMINGAQSLYGNEIDDLIEQVDKALSEARWVALGHLDA